jgi:hypothetical protein
MFQRGTLIQEVGVSENYQGGLKTKRRGLWIVAPTLQHLQEGGGKTQWTNLTLVLLHATQVYTLTVGVHLHQGLPGTLWKWYPTSTQVHQVLEQTLCSALSFMFLVVWIQLPGRVHILHAGFSRSGEEDNIEIL